MTNGEPVVVRGAMKPLPTLTKPLRSVDIATKEPAQALRERTDSCTVPAAGVVGRGDGGPGAGLRLPGEARRRPHRRRARARSPPTASGSDGGRRSRRPGAASPARASVRSCSWASWAPASPPRRARRPRSSAWRRSTPTGSSSAGSASRSQSYFDREGEAAFREREEEVVLELLAGGARRGGGARRRRRAVRARCARRSGPTRWCSSRCDPEDAWRRASGGGRPLARDQARFEQLQRDREPLYATVADAVLPPGGRDAMRARAARARSAPRGARRARGSSGPAPPRATTRCSSAAGLIGSGFAYPRDGRRFVVTDTNVAPPPAGGGPTNWSWWSPARSGRRSPRPRRCCAAWRAAGRSAAISWSRWAAGWWGTWRASAPPCTSAACATCRCPPRSWRRWTPPTAGRRAWTCPRGRTTPAPTTSRRRCCATRRRWRRCPPAELAAGYAEVVKTALIAGGGAVGARAPGRRP